MNLSEGNTVDMSEGPTVFPVTLKILVGRF